ncbi:ficolin-1-like [Drosophila innubila]|uniref:ficolin-1-like n=1 Tax=Drosophila innubila TaxID=198719 RepID=UPI00148CA1E2|nr:ficolin-1-like [Drosophila innubila]
MKAKYYWLILIVIKLILFCSWRFIRLNRQSESHAETLNYAIKMYKQPAVVKLPEKSEPFVDLRSSLMFNKLQKAHKEKEKLDICDNNKLKKYEETPGISCIPYRDSLGVHAIKVPDFDAFDVLCDNGWTVIQQRVNGSLDLDRNWDSYRKGFGCFDGDFFLGLEKIHHLTKNKPHELYIYLESLIGIKTWARYDHFEITDENDGYRLINLGVFSGNATKDAMRHHENQKFSTEDRDNDSVPWNCAKIYNSGWWYKNCMYSNLNLDSVSIDGANVIEVYWNEKMYVKQEKMFIRPKS